MISHYHFISEFYNKVVNDFFGNPIYPDFHETAHFKNNLESAHLLTALITSGFNFTVLTGVKLPAFDRDTNKRTYIDGFGFFEFNGNWYVNRIEDMCKRNGIFYHGAGVWDLSDKRLDKYRDPITGTFYGLDELNNFAKLHYQENSSFDDIELISHNIVHLITNLKEILSSKEYKEANFRTTLIKDGFFSVIYLEKFKKQIINMPHLSNTTVQQLVNAFFDLLHGLIWNGETVCIENLGNFKVLVSPSRMGRNPKTGEKALIPEQTKIHKTPYNPDYEDDRQYKDILKIQKKKNKEVDINSNKFSIIYFEDQKHQLTVKFEQFKQDFQINDHGFGQGYNYFRISNTNGLIFHFEILVSTAFATFFLKALGYAGEQTLEPIPQSHTVGGSSGFFF
jgi:nucleoid DNA-binding protein